MLHVTALQLNAWLSDKEQERPQLLDVREPWEFGVCRIDGSVNIPMRAVPVRTDEFAREQPLVVICHHGARSFQVGMFLERAGFSNVINLTGGVAAWAVEVDTSMPTY
jgi:rhodanese-related sulfurtransferase